MKFTVLEMVQRILESLGDDEVNSINDTIRATQVANIIEENFNELISRGDIAEHHDFYQLIASGDSAKPTLMTLPSDAISLDFLKYDKQTTTDSGVQYHALNFTPLQEFLRLNSGLDPDASNVGSFTQTIDSDTFTFYYRTDDHPSFFTTWDDNTLVFDSYDSAEESTLTKARTQAYGLVQPSFVVEDSHTPDLDHRQFTLLIQASKAQAFEEIKQTRLHSAEKKERRAWNTLGRTNKRLGKTRAIDDLPNYGRQRGIR